MQFKPFSEFDFFFLIDDLLVESKDEEENKFHLILLWNIDMNESSICYRDKVSNIA